MVHVLTDEHATTESDVCAVIVHFETPDWLDSCLTSLVASSGPLRLQVIVVDNASRGTDIDDFRARYPNVLFIANPTNRGFAAAANQGLRIARARYLLVMNPDTIVNPDTLEVMVAVMDSQNDVGCATPRLIMPNGRLDPACRRMFPTPRRAFFRLSLLNRLLPQSRRLGEYNLAHLDEFSDTDIDSPCGAFMLVRRQTLEQVGLLDERYFMYGEDLDWAFRIKSAGWRIVYTSRTSAHHEKRASSRLNRPTTVRYFHDAMRIFYSDHYAASYPRVFSWLVMRAIDIREAFELTAERMRGRRHPSQLPNRGSAS